MIEGGESSVKLAWMAPNRRPLVRDDKWKAKFEVTRREIEEERRQKSLATADDSHLCTGVVREASRRLRFRNVSMGGQPMMPCEDIYALVNKKKKENTSALGTTSIPSNESQANSSHHGVSINWTLSFPPIQANGGHPPSASSPHEPEQTCLMRFHTSASSPAEVIEKRFRAVDTIATVNRFLASKGCPQMKIRSAQDEDATSLRQLASAADNFVLVGCGPGDDSEPIGMLYLHQQASKQNRYSSLAERIASWKHI